MKVFIVLTVLSAICGSQAAGIPSLTAVADAIFEPRVVDAIATCGGSYGTKCADDCYTMLICLGPGVEPSQSKCGTDKPYCDQAKNICTTEKPAGNPKCDAAPPTTFRCSAATGFFPHPTNCSQYFECDNSEIYNYHCPPNYVWDTDGMGCKQKKVTADCGTITCKTDDLTAPLTSNTTFFGYCGVTDALGGVVVSKCPGLEKYDTATKGCLFVCPAEGLFGDVTNPTWYYECYKSGTKTVFTYNECFGGRTFDDEQQRCVAAPPAAGGA